MQAPLFRFAKVRRKGEVIKKILFRGSPKMPSLHRTSLFCYFQMLQGPSKARIEPSFVQRIRPGIYFTDIVKDKRSETRLWRWIVQREGLCRDFWQGVRHRAKRTQ
jgi:hypothetical protein